MDTAVVIVNYKTVAATTAAVASVLPDLDQLGDSLIVVVDNASGDDSAERLAVAFRELVAAGRLVLICSPHNGGFGAGVNRGVDYLRRAAAPPRTIYVLNPDAVIDPGALVKLVAFMETHPDAGLLGNLIRESSGDSAKAFRFPSPLRELEGTARLGLVTRLLHAHRSVVDPVSSGPVDWVAGTSLLIRTEMLAAVGTFDEGFFLYFEEIDFARRIAAAGWKVYFVADVGVAHVGGLATGLKDESRRMPLYWFASRRRYLVKHHGRFYAAACDAAWICGHAIIKAKFAILGKRRSLRPRVGRDFLSYSLRHLFAGPPTTPPPAAPAGNLVKGAPDDRTHPGAAAGLR